MTQFIMRVLFVALIGTFDIITRTEQKGEVDAVEYWRVVKQGDIVNYTIPLGARESGIRDLRSKFTNDTLFEFCELANAVVNTVLRSTSNQVLRPQSYDDLMGTFKVQKNRDADEKYVRGYRCKVASGSRSFLLRVIMYGPSFLLKAYIEDGPMC